jgi:hypothetical protein
VRRIIEGVAYTLLAEGPPIEEGDPQAEEAGPTAVITVHNYAGALGGHSRAYFTFTAVKSRRASPRASVEEPGVAAHIIATECHNFIGVHSRPRGIHAATYKYAAQPSSAAG